MSWSIWPLWTDGSRSHPRGYVGPDGHHRRHDIGLRCVTANFLWWDQVTSMSVWRGVLASRATAVVAAAAVVISLGLFLTLRSVPLVRAAGVDGVAATASDSVTSTPPPSATADPSGGWDCASQGRS